MGHYKSNLRDLEFNLFEVFDRSSVLGAGPYEDVDVDTAQEILREVARLSENELADSFFDADRNPPVFDPAAGTVAMPGVLQEVLQGLPGRRAGACCRSPASWAARSSRRL